MPRGCWSSTEATPVLRLGRCRSARCPRCCAASPRPVILERADDPAERVFLLAHDSDPFNKWEAGRTSALILLSRMAEDPAAAPDDDFLAALAAVADDSALDPAFKALALGLPPEEEVIAHMAAHRADARSAGDLGRPSSPGGGCRTRAVGGACGRSTTGNAVPGPYSPDAAAAGSRALRARALALLTALDPACGGCARPVRRGRQHDRANGRAGASRRARKGRGGAGRIPRRWAHDRLVIDKWFSVQAAGTPPETAVATVDALTRHPDFDWKNPNRFRALIGAFAMGNPAGFHAADGSGYRLLVDWLIRLDPVNPQTTARIAATLGSWRIFDAGRQALMQGELERLAALPGLSRDTGEIVGRLLRGNDA